MIRSSTKNKTLRIPSLSRWMLVGLFLVLAGTLTSCDSRDEDTDFEELQWIYLYVTRDSDVRSICLETMITPFQCAEDTGITGASELYIRAYESVYGFTVASPRGRAELCDSIVATEDYPFPSLDEGKTVSTGTKGCYLRCESAYYQRSLDAGKCTATDYSSLNPTNDEAYKTCAEDCLTEASILPP